MISMRMFSGNYDHLVSGCHHGMSVDKEVFKKFFRKLFVQYL